MRFNAGASSMSQAWSTASRRCGPRRMIFASRQRSAPDRFFPAQIPRSRLVHASCTAEPAEESKLRVSIQERRAAASALAIFLREKKGFKLSEASGIRSGSPVFAAKLAMLARSVAGSLETKSGSALVLHEEKINVGEALLESLGASPEWAEEMASGFNVGDERMQGILRIVQLLENLGLPRKKMWILFDCNESLWSSSPAEVESSISALHELVSSKELVRMIEFCPLLLGRGSEELLNGFISLLREIGLEARQVSNLLNLFQSKAISLRPVNLMLQELGLPKGDTRHLLISCPLAMAELVNSSLSSAKSWFQSHGILDEVFWKLAVSNPVAGCRSTEVLEAQLSLLRKFGISPEEAFCLMIKHPQCLPGIHLLEPKLEYLFRVMEYPVQVLLGCPRYLRCSLEGNIKPRHQLVEFLVEQGKMAKPGTPSYLFMTEEAFLLAHGSLHENALEVYKLASGASPVEVSEEQPESVSPDVSSEARSEFSNELSGAGSISGIQSAGVSSEVEDAQKVYRLAREASPIEVSEEQQPESVPGEARGEFSNELSGTGSISGEVIVKAELELQESSWGIQSAEVSSEVEDALKVYRLATVEVSEEQQPESVSGGELSNDLSGTGSISVEVIVKAELELQESSWGIQSAEQLRVSSEVEDAPEQLREEVEVSSEAELVLPKAASSPETGSLEAEAPSPEASDNPSSSPESTTIFFVSEIHPVDAPNSPQETSPGTQEGFKLVGSEVSCNSSPGTSPGTLEPFELAPENRANSITPEESRAEANLNTSHEFPEQTPVAPEIESGTSLGSEKKMVMEEIETRETSSGSTSGFKSTPDSGESNSTTMNKGTSSSESPASAPDQKLAEQKIAADNKAKETRRTGVLGFIRSIFNGF